MGQPPLPGTGDAQQPVLRVVGPDGPPEPQDGPEEADGPETGAHGPDGADGPDGPGEEPAEGEEEEDADVRAVACLKAAQRDLAWLRMEDWLAEYKAIERALVAGGPEPESDGPPPFSFDDPLWLEAVGADRWEPIRRLAEIQGVSPWGLLGAVLARLGPLVGPYCGHQNWRGKQGADRLPLFVALLGPSGFGKTETNTAAAHLVPYPKPPTDDDPEGSLVDPAEVRPPSGSGLIKRLRHKMPKLPGDKGPAVWARIYGLLAKWDEAAMLEHWQRQGSGGDLHDVMRSAWAGEPMASDAAQADRRVAEVRSHVISALLNAQPSVGAGVIDKSTGTLQRWLALPVWPETSPSADAAGPDVEWPAPFGISREADRDNGPLVIPVRDGIIPEMHLIDRSRRAALDDGQPANSRLPEWWAALDHGLHTLWLRLRVATLLAILKAGGAEAAAEAGVRRAQWDAAAVLMQVSAATRLFWIDEIQIGLKQTDEAIGKSKARRAQVGVDQDDDRVTAAVRTAVAKIAAKVLGEVVKRSDVSRITSGDDRGLARRMGRNLTQEVLDACSEGGVLAHQEPPGKHWVRV